MSAATLPPQTWNDYRSNLPRHLMGLARYQQSLLMHRLIEEHGYEDLSLHFEPYITLAGGSGVVLTELAEVLGITRQAVNQTVNQLERAGYLLREPVPEDRRAKRVVLTTLGRQLAADGMDLLVAVEADFIDIIGEQALRRFCELLARLYDAMGFRAPDVPRRRAALSWLLPRISGNLARDLMERTRSRGHPGLKMSFAQVLTLMTPEGGRIQEMARINEVSKQAISAIANELEDLGYLARLTDPNDARQVILVFTPEGARLIADSIQSTAALGSDFEKIIGTAELAELTELAKTLYRELGLESSVFDNAPVGLDNLADEIVRSLGKRRSIQLAGKLVQITEQTA